MKIYTQDELKNRFNKLSFVWKPFHLIGTRSLADAVNLFDDNFYLINGAGMKMYTGTTNPGTDWLTTFLNPKGAAVLASDRQYIDCWQLGLHHGEYPAWTQAKPLSVFRDADKDGKSEEEGKVDVGMFGINIHHANASAKSKLIGKWSAGCQVFDDPMQHLEFMNISRATGQKFFTYSLLREF